MLEKLLFDHKKFFIFKYNLQTQIIKVGIFFFDRLYYSTVSYFAVNLFFIRTLPSKNSIA